MAHFEKEVFWKIAAFSCYFQLVIQEIKANTLNFAMEP